MKPIRITLLTAAVILIAISAIAIACAPSAPNNQGGESENATATPGPTPEIGDPVPTLAGTPAMIYLHNPEGTLTPHIAPPPKPLTPPVLPSHLQKQIERREATQEAQRSAGEREETGEAIWITINLDSDDRIDEVAKYLEKKSITIVGKDPRSPITPPTIIAIVRISKIREISELEGVVRIKTIPNSAPGSSNQRTQPKPSGQSLAEQHGIDTWHAAGIEGQTIEVGVIDSGFRSFTMRLGKKFADTVTALCFPIAVDDQDEQLNPTNTLSDCEHGTEHGTNVVEKLQDIVPKAKIYISNPQNRVQLKQAVNWMTAKNQDNERRILGGYRPEIGPTPSYEASENNNFNIKVINHSRSHPWDGPGDGSSPFRTSARYSPLNSADDAINNGAIWVNSAGNEGERTWFSREVRYHGEYVKFNPAVDNNTCNMVDLKADHDYTFQLRWSGPWPGADKDLDLYLFGPKASDGTRTRIGKSEAVQNGGNSEPSEMIEAMQIATTGEHCLMVKNENQLQNPDWIQLQLHQTDDDEAALTSVLNRLGGISNPAENDGDSMLAVGDAESFLGVAVRLASSRGPVPEPIPNGHIEPDVVAITTHPSGTSFAAPVVAGMAALVIQALGNRDSYNESHEIVNYIKTKAVQLRTDPTAHQPTDTPTQPRTNIPVLPVTSSPNNESGHGLAYLPQMEVPSDLQLTKRGIYGLTLSFTTKIWDASPRFVSGSQSARIEFETVINGVGTVLGSASVSLASESKTYRTVRPRGHTHRARIKRCIRGTPSFCTDWSPYSNEIYLPLAPVKPRSAYSIPSDAAAIIKWDNPGDTTAAFEVQQLGGATETFETNRAVIRELQNGTTYQFRIRAFLDDEISEWTGWVSVTPENRNPGIPPYLNVFRQGDDTISLDWDGVSNADIYEVQQWDGTAARNDGTGKKGVWRTIPFEEKGKTQDYAITFIRSLGIVKHLTPGTEYKYRVRSTTLEKSSPWSEQVSGTTTGQRPVVTPVPSPTPTAEPNKTNPSNVVARLSGSDVIITWTPGYNPNYVRQEVMRRIAGVRPEDWTTFSLGINVNTYTDTTGESGVTYIYRVQAWKSAGNPSESTNGDEITIP